MSDEEILAIADDEDEPGDPGSPASEPVDRADPPDALDRALDLANRGGGKLKPP